MSKKLFHAFRVIFEDDTYFKIIESLAEREGANLRETAREVGLSHKNLSKYLVELTRKGVIDSFPAGRRIKIYRLSDDYAFLKFYFPNNNSKKIVKRKFETN